MPQIKYEEREQHIKASLEKDGGMSTALRTAASWNYGNPETAVDAAIAMLAGDERAYTGAIKNEADPQRFIRFVDQFLRSHKREIEKRIAGEPPSDSVGIRV